MTELPLPKGARGRGARSNRSGRYEALEIVEFDDGWTDHEGLVQIETTLTPLHSKTIITRNESPDVGFDRSINPYVGCVHGCVYAYVTH